MDIHEMMDSQSTGGLFPVASGVLMTSHTFRRHVDPQRHHQRRIQGVSRPSRRQSSIAA
jgi:hypothetical protein